MSRRRTSVLILGAAIAMSIVVAFLIARKWEIRVAGAHLMQRAWLGSQNDVIQSSDSATASRSQAQVQKISAHEKPPDAGRSTDPVRGGLASQGISQQIPRKLPKSQEEVLEYIERGNLLYTHIVEELGGVESLPALYGILANKDHLPKWNAVAAAIAYLGKNKESYGVLVDYVQRHDSWETLSEPDAVQLIMGKVMALRLFGLVGGAEGEHLLASVLTDPRYAQEFLSKWIDYPIVEGLGDRSRVLMEARGAAALGLVFTQARENVELVRSIHQTALEDSNRAEAATRQNSSPNDRSIHDNTCKYEFYLCIVHALAVDKYVKSKNLGDYLDKSGSNEIRLTMRALEREIEKEDGNVGMEATGK